MHGICCNAASNGKWYAKLFRLSVRSIFYLMCLDITMEIWNSCHMLLNVMLKCQLTVWNERQKKTSNFLVIPIKNINFQHNNISAPRFMESSLWFLENGFSSSFKDYSVRGKKAESWLVPSSEVIRIFFKGTAMLFPTQLFPIGFRCRRFFAILL